MRWGGKRGRPLAGERFDAAVIGASADGLAAAAMLARAGLSTVVLERGQALGGRWQTRAFHEGFRAGAFADEFAPIPASIFWSLGLAARGAIFAPQPAALALFSGGLSGSAPCQRGALAEETASRVSAILARAEAQSGPTWRWRRGGGARSPWPSEDWAQQSLVSAVERGAQNEAEAALAIGMAVSGRAVDPFLAGSAMHLVAPGVGGAGVLRGGPEALGKALADGAREAGVAIRPESEVTDIRIARRTVVGLGLADGSEIAARAILSTLDFKRTFLSLFSWSQLPPELVSRLSAYRMAGSTARFLVALARVPDFSAFHAPPRGPIVLAQDFGALAEASASWRQAEIPSTPPITLRVPSLTDPSLAPPGAATLTATIGCIPFRLFDGAWTHEKRERLQKRILDLIEAALPGTAKHVVGTQLILPPDIEEALALTDGDLTGGDLSADNMLALRPTSRFGGGPRTPFRRLYLAGPSTTAGIVASCASGVFAARALIADLKRGWLA
jgi:phytoene dehydrogenase-like protein